METGFNKKPFWSAKLKAEVRPGHKDYFALLKEQLQFNLNHPTYKTCRCSGCEDNRKKWESTLLLLNNGVG